MVSHGIMFHHFHGGEHAASQGSLSAENLSRVVDHLSKFAEILPADRWMEKAMSGKLQQTELCLTFDDGLLSQYDIAGPVLRDRGLTAFWFVYSESFGTPRRNFELFRAFRHKNFANIELFYSAFQRKILESPFQREAVVAIESGLADSHLSEFKFYSASDRRFRYLRDVVLGRQAYEDLMLEMMTSLGFDFVGAYRSLWLRKKHLLELRDGGHVIGLHSYSHPTDLKRLPFNNQVREYGENKEHLEGIIGEAITAMSHPCNSYSNDTLQILKSLGIQIGFRSNMCVTGGSLLEQPREDSAIMMQRLGV